jgi:hypothetical protein
MPESSSVPDHFPGVVVVFPGLKPTRSGRVAPVIDWHCVLDRETHKLVTEPFDSLEDLQAWVKDARAVEDPDRWIVVRLVDIPVDAQAVSVIGTRLDGWVWERS